MFGRVTSISQKIIVSYFAAVAVIIGLSIITYVTLSQLEKKIMFGAVVSELFDYTLEIRRFEKNYFLYEEQTDFTENLGYVSKAQEIIRLNAVEYSALAVNKQMDGLAAILSEYRTLMEQCADISKLDRQSKASLELSVRDKGKALITMAEGISKTERNRLAEILGSTRTNIVLLIVVLSVAGLAIGQILSMIVVRPLKHLEKTMRAIASGEFKTITIESRDREIVSLANALNAMLRELELRQRHLLQSEKLASLGTLLSGVAHELNNPLSNISTSSQILMEEMETQDPAYRMELITQIDEQTERAKNIVRSLLEFSRSREFKREDLQLLALVEETLRFIKGQMPARVGIKLDVPPEIFIFADKQRMQQVFLNLFKNAVEALGQEGQVTVRARRQRADKAYCPEKALINNIHSGSEYISIQVCDSGPGIPEELLPRIFDPFFTTKDVGKGSGLGLAIVHEIISEHDGFICAESEVGVGTTFHIHLPAKERS